MLEFIVRNLSTIIVGAVVLGILAAVTIKMIRDRINHKSSCAGNCANCPNSNVCRYD